MVRASPLSKILELYDHDERFAATSPDVRREELPNLVRQVDLLGHTGTVIYSRLSAQTADPAIEGEIAYFRSIGQDVEWKAYAHDEPADLIQRLVEHGCVRDETETIMVLELDQAPPELLAATPNVRRIGSPQELVQVESVRSRVWGDDDDDDHIARLAAELEQDPDYVSVYVADVDGAPAASGRICFPRSSAFASLWGGSTVPELRNRGLYTALLAARVQEARSRGWRYLTVDARSMSRPILEKRGFVALTHATACTWCVGSQTSTVRI
jgi:GNAT superfamily N-acetyltransferase